MNSYIFMAVEYTIEFANPALKPKRAQALISTKDWKKAHWGASPSHTSMDSLKDMKVLKAYGTPQGEDGIDNILRQYQKDFPPKPCDIEAETVKDVDGWLSPEGVFYKCGWMGHSNLALDLAVGVVDLGDDEDRYEDALYRIGWLGISHSGIMGSLYEGVQPTAAQLSWLNRLKELNAGFDNYVKNIERFVRMASRASA